MTLLADDVELLRPRYWSSDANAPIELGRAAIRLDSSGIQANGQGVARLAMLPRKQVRVSVILDGTGNDVALSRLDGGDDLTLTFGDLGRPTRVIATRSTFTSDGQTSMDLVLRTGGFTLCRDRRVRLASVLVSIFNFPPFLGPMDFRHIDQAGSSIRLGRVLLEGEGWQIEVQESPSTRALVAQLGATGGNATTHVARLRRVDGESISPGQAEGILNAFQQFLSFARGYTTSLFGATGFDRSGRVVWEQWAEYPSSPWGGRLSWFDAHHAEALAELFPGFLRLRNDPAIGEDVSAALYWYLRSNRGGEGPGSDGALILTQAALERLADGCLAAGRINTRGDRIAKMRAMCDALGLPRAIPKPLSYLRRGKRKGAWIDGPAAVTTIRDNLVHPRRRSPVPIGPSVIEGWRLGQWYLELAILGLAGYAGAHSNRLATRWVGEVEPVPWARGRARKQHGAS